MNNENGSQRHGYYKEQTRVFLKIEKKIIFHSQHHLYQANHPSDNIEQTGDEPGLKGEEIGENVESRVQVVHLGVKDNYSQPHCIVSIVISEKDEMETSTMARFMCTFFIDTDVKF